VSRLGLGRPEAILARAKSLLSDHLPRSFLDATDPRCDEYAPPPPPPVPLRARPTSPPALSLLDDDDAGADDAVIVGTAELHAATTQVIVLVFCGACRHRHLEPAVGYAHNPFYRCGRCDGLNELPALALDVPS
jgi:hypothetical protein